MSKAAEKEAQPSVDMEMLSKKKLEDTTFADLVSNFYLPLQNWVDLPRSKLTNRRFILLGCFFSIM
jgi:hypothetical protein